MLTIGLAYETKSFFQDFAYNTPAGVDRLTFNQPGVLTGGVAVRPLEMLLVAADVSWIDWPTTNGANLPAYSQNASGAMPWNMNWSSQVVFKIGVQVTPLDWLAVRAGFNYGKMPLDASRAFENIAFPAVAETHLTLGAGFNLGKHVAINLGGMWAPSTSISGSNPLPPRDAGLPRPVRTGHRVLHHVDDPGRARRRNRLQVLAISSASPGRAPPVQAGGALFLGGGRNLGGLRVLKDRYTRSSIRGNPMQVREILSIAVLGTLLAACGSGTSTAPATMNVRLVDAPSSGYKEVNVDVRTVEIASADGWLVLGTPNRVINLLALTGGVYDTLVDGAPLPAGHYGQMRLVLGPDNSVMLLDGTVAPLKVPSGQQSGVKLTVNFDIQPGTTADVYIDFDAHRSVFVHEAGASGKYILRPTVRAYDRLETGSISGTFTVDGSAAPLPGVVVTAQTVTSGTPAVVRSTITDAAGHYVLDLLPRDGTYHVVSQPVTYDLAGLVTGSYEPKASPGLTITVANPVRTFDASFSLASATGGSDRSGDPGRHGGSGGFDRCASRARRGRSPAAVRGPDGDRGRGGGRGVLRDPGAAHHRSLPRLHRRRKQEEPRHLGQRDRGHEPSRDGRGGPGRDGRRRRRLLTGPPVHQGPGSARGGPLIARGRGASAPPTRGAAP